MHIQCLVLLVYLSNVLCQLRSDGKCTRTSFRCSNGQCIPSTSVCDGAADCTDRSDETLAVCTELALPCPPFAFRCAYGACVDKSSKCNGVKDCADNSDELIPDCVKQKTSVLCKKYEFECNSGQCIDSTSLCDGASDCIDGSDETITQCIDIGCPGYSFQCAYGGCIDKKKKCDGKEDCKDGSDEDTELCKNYTKLSVTTEKPKVTYTSRPRPVISNGCLLPDKPKDGDYEVSDCEEGNFSDKCRKVPGTVVMPNVIISYSCHPGYLLPENIEHSFCKKGVWSPQVPRCQKLCKGLRSDSVDLTCLYRGSEVDCSKPVRPETELKTKCKNAYHLSDNSASFTVTQCMDDGTWGSDLYKCLPDCGIRNVIDKVVKPAIKKGYSTKQSEYPWHAAIYRDNNGIFDCICGGSIIHPKAIITAAHCVFNETFKRPTDKKLLRVGVGKYRSSWDLHESTEDQRFKVVEIIIQAAYYGKSNRYEQDIAILDLDKLIILSSGVMPICFDRHDSLSLYRDPMAVGTVVGWGITDNNKESDVLLVARLPFFDFRNCRNKVGFDKFSQYITYDKFCAGLDNGTSVQQGDSGGALTFPMLVGSKEQHFIYGIVSLKPSDSDSIAAFTNVTVHMEWVDKVLGAIKFKKPNI